MYVFPLSSSVIIFLLPKSCCPHLFLSVVLVCYTITVVEVLVVTACFFAVVLVRFPLLVVARPVVTTPLLFPCPLSVTFSLMSLPVFSLVLACFSRPIEGPDAALTHVGVEKDVPLSGAPHSPCDPRRCLTRPANPASLNITRASLLEGVTGGRGVGRVKLTIEVKGGDVKIEE